MFTIKPDFKSFIKNNPVTVAIITICLLITIAITILGGYTKSNLVLLGAYDKDLINNGEFWRLFTYTFNHMSYLHFVLIEKWSCDPYSTKDDERTLNELGYDVLIWYKKEKKWKIHNEFKGVRPCDIPLLRSSPFIKE